MFQYDALTDAWHLVEFQTTPAPEIFLVEGDGVKAIVTDTLLVQVLLKVKGSFSDGCQALGKINQRLQDNRSEVVIHTVSTIPRDGTVACTTVLGPFEKVVPLQVYGLPAGTYEYIVNGEHTGTFDLTSDNKL